jgi:tRNA A-37 threonylcarbamoyl transferase component Bud32
VTTALREIRVAPRHGRRSWLNGELSCLCREDVAHDVARIYDDHPWVWDQMRERQDVTLLRGRHPVLTGPLGPVQAVVKRLYHGGALSPILGDRFLSPARIRNHITVTRFLRDRGIATPPVLFVSWRRVNGLVRGELATEMIGAGADADDYLFTGERPGDWQDLAAKIGAMTAALHRLDFFHPDLNLMNFYFTAQKEIFILDLDKSSLTAAVLAPEQRTANLARLERSVRKQGRERDAQYVEAVVREIHRSYEANLSS